MSRKLLSLLLAAVLLALPVVAQASVTSVFDVFDKTGKLNEIKFQNREVFIDRAGNIVAPPTSNPTSDTYLVSIFSATEIWVYNTPQQATKVWTWNVDGATTGYLLGYGVQKVKNASTSAIDYMNTDFDPGSLIGNPLLKQDGSSMLGIYQAANNWNVSSGNWVTDLTNSLITGQTLTKWAEFGISGATNFASYQAFPATFGNILGLAGYGLDIIDNPNGLVFADPGLGGDLGGTATITKPPVGFIGNWQAFSNDPVAFALVPEPATMAMWGSFLAIGAVVALRRRRK